MRLVEGARAVVGRRSVLATLVRRDLKVRYASSVLGWVWSVLDPLMMALVYWFLFTQIIDRSDIGLTPYLVFLITGLFAWQWFAGTLSEGSRALLSAARLMRTTNVPREIWVARVVLSKGMEFVFTLPVLAAVVAVYGVVPNWRLVLFPVAMLVQALMLTGIVMILAPLTVLVRDVQRVVRIFLRVGFYMTPVIYSLESSRAAGVGDVIAFNPMAGVIELYRAGLFDEPLHATSLVVTGVATLVLLALGSLVFGRLERAVLKEL
jgi:ABC-2 type transport system permease protein